MSATLRSLSRIAAMMFRADDLVKGGGCSGPEEGSGREGRFGWLWVMRA
jgi:hypothetical protein